MEWEIEEREKEIKWTTSLSKQFISELSNAFVFLLCLRPCCHPCPSQLQTPRPSQGRERLPLRASQLLAVGGPRPCGQSRGIWRSPSTCRVRPSAWCSGSQVEGVRSRTRRNCLPGLVATVSALRELRLLEVLVLLPPGIPQNWHQIEPPGSSRSPRQQTPVYVCLATRRSSGPSPWPTRSRAAV